MKSKALFLKTAIINAALVTTIIIAGSSCNNENSKPENTKTVAEEHNDAKFSNENEKDAQFLVNAAEINLEEMDLGKLAQTKSDMNDVKELGKMMEDTHMKSQNDLAGLAKKKSVTLPAATTDKGKEAYNKLNEKEGNKFNKAYCDMMVDGHKDAISKFEKEIAETSDQDIKDWASATLPVLRTHLDHAITCQKKCDKM